MGGARWWRGYGYPVAVLALLLVAVLRYGLMPIGGWDVWWHLETGEQILASGTWLARDPFSYTQQGAAWPYKDAGAALLMHGVHRAAGFGGLVLLKALVFATSVAALLATLVKQREVPLPLAAMVVALTIEAVAFRFHERPQTFSLCGVVLALWIIERHRAGRGALWLLVPLCLVVANLHRGVLLVPLIGAAYALSLALRRPLPWRSVVAVAMVSLAAALACLLTPSGTAIVDTSVRLMREPGFREWSPEWFAPTLVHVWRASPATFGMALLALVGVALRGRDQDPWDWCLLAIGVLVGSRAVRLLPLFSLLVAAPAATGLARATGIWRGRIGRGLGLAAPLVGVLYAAISPLPAPRIGLQEHRYPEAALRFVHQQGIRGRVMHDLRFGGYLMFSGYPERQVYIDGRNDIVYPLDFLRTATSVFHDPALFAAEHRRWQVEWLLLANQPDVRVRAHIDYDPAWRLVFASEPALVYVRSDGVNRQVALDHGYRILAAHELQQTLTTAIGAGRPKLAEAARDEARRMVREDEQSYAAHLALALAYRLSGPRYEAQAAEQLDIARALGARR